MQVDIGDLKSAAMLPFVDHFRALWTRVFEAFLRRGSPDERFCFTAELLASNIYYAREFGGREESDRWQQSLVLTQIARECFGEARKQLG
jgi:hypothetical protein